LVRLRISLPGARCASVRAMRKKEVARPAARLQATVVIPTHNRRESLQRLLHALAAQSVHAETFEAIVVADGCSDDTADAVRSSGAPFALSVIELPHLGAAAARNRGAAVARGDVLVFLDDDLDPVAMLLEEHLQMHQRHPGALVLGCSQPVAASRTLLDAERCRWWQDHILELRRLDHRFTYRDLHSGNFSISAELFRAVGGFCEDLPCREDYELGARLLARGVEFVFCEGGFGYHHDGTDLARSVRRAFLEGRADVLIAHRHPGLLNGLALASELYPDLARVRRRAFRRLGAGGTWSWLARRRLAVLERCHLRGRTVRLARQLLTYSYFRGVAAELGSIDALRRLLAAAPPNEGPDALLDVDLRTGLAAARRLLDERRPRGARLLFGDFEIAVLPSDDGAESLRGAHLSRALLSSDRLLAALAVETATRGRPNLDEWFGSEASLQDEVGVSVIVAADQPAELAAALESLAAQSHRRWEAVVVSDLDTFQAGREAAGLQRDVRIRHAPIGELAHPAYERAVEISAGKLATDFSGLLVEARGKRTLEEQTV
jgi:glycosyltransferase involved in cell wall biosynthesis